MLKYLRERESGKRCPDRSVRECYKAANLRHEKRYRKALEGLRKELQFLDRESSRLIEFYAVCNCETHRVSCAYFNEAHRMFSKQGQLLKQEKVLLSWMMYPDYVDAVDTPAAPAPN